MKTYKYRILVFFFLLGIGLHAQTFDKKVNESFKVNYDVELAINASHTDITIETWNKNEVEVEAVMEVEGVSKEEANRILGKWQFEALGNSNKVKITTVSGSLNYDFDFPEIDIPEMDFDFEEIDFPEIEIPEFNFPEFEFPEMPEIEEIEFDYEAYKNDSTYLKEYKLRVQEQAKKFKNSDWRKKMDSIRDTEEYKRNLAEMKKASKEMEKEMKTMKNSKEFKQANEEVMKSLEKARMELLENKKIIELQTKVIKKAAKEAMEKLEVMKENGTIDSIHNFSENIYFNYSDSGNSKIKIRKAIKIKVPKNATFDLNVRHGKLKIPASNKKMTATISYGNFIGGIIIGEKNELRFSNSPVVIEVLNSSNVTLKNVPNATFGIVENANLFSNSSDVLIKEIGNNSDVSHKFGSLEISKITSNFNSFNLILDYSKATVNISDTDCVFQINNKKSSISLSGAFNEDNKKNKDGVAFLSGFYKDKSSLNKLFLTAIYSTIDIK